MAAIGQYQRAVRFAAHLIGGSITVQRVLGGNGVGNLYYDSSDVPGFSLPDTLETLQTDTIPAWALVSSV